MRVNRLILGWLSLCSLCALSAAWAEEMTAQELMQKAYQVYGGDDSISRLSFMMEKKKLVVRRLDYLMVWKKYEPKTGVDFKVMFFNEYPLDDQGKSYMGWFYRAETAKQEEEWMYLPELRMVRKLAHKHHQHDVEHDDFSPFELQRGDLPPRAPDRDVHTLLAPEELEGETFDVIQSQPKMASEDYPYSKTVTKLRRPEGLPVYIDYYDKNGHLHKQQQIKWKQIGDAWVWEEVSVVNVMTEVRAVLKISDVRLNLGLEDALFSSRSLMRGREKFEAIKPRAGK